MFELRSVGDSPQGLDGIVPACCSSNQTRSARVEYGNIDLMGFSWSQDVDGSTRYQCGLGQRLSK